ncbi:hypothetical protein SUGI_0129740 [Cryptomeria japonica]|uniref:indole-3-acetic acid-induced protein ARG7-like n=1 Tax=Cryptomeria japonica TaxID=3369 RepID=UPI002408E507|nr:indole-3-acetic acid-induced protein ARG7-like [Cryptomeria japonica]GLJ10523.1 hypothetical protein SUGI_0129740 [Cryptomeria japonica]
MELSRVAKMVRSIRRWQKLSNGGSGKISKSNYSVPLDVPEGHLAVYAGFGCEIKRFIVPAVYFNHSLFRPLLDKVEEEFGFNNSGPILIPCKPYLFQQILCLLGGDCSDMSNWNNQQVIAWMSEMEMVVSADLSTSSNSLCLRPKRISFVTGC